MKVYNECCKNCLLSKDRIVSAKRAKEIISGCAKDQTHFICHKASIEGKDIVCKSFFDSLGHVSQLVRIASRLKAIVFIDQTDTKKLPPFQNKLKQNNTI